MLVGAHGSGLANMVFMPSHASVLEMRPRGWPVAVFRHLAAACSLQYFSTWGEGKKTSPLSVDMSDVKMKLEHIRSHVLGLK